MPIVVIFHTFFTIIHFSTFLAERTDYPLPQVGQFVKKSFYIQLLIHIGIQFNQELSGAVGFAQNITPPINTLTPQSTVNNLHIDFVAWKELIQKPRGNIFASALAKTISRNSDDRLHNQCINQRKDEIKISLSVFVII
jgi:hypothetical protein